MSHCSDFWNALAQFHAEVEDSNFDLVSVRRLLPEIESPVLAVGAGQGLIVAELRKYGHECDGVDLSSEMIRQAKLRGGIRLVKADAKTMPFPAATWETIIYATGVVDFTAEEDEIHAMLTEGRRVVKEAIARLCVGRQYHAYETLGDSHQWHEFPDAFRVSQVTPQRLVSCNCSRPQHEDQACGTLSASRCLHVRSCVKLVSIFL